VEKSFNVVRSTDEPSNLLDIIWDGDEYSPIILVDQSSTKYDPDQIHPIIDAYPCAKLVYLAEQFDMESMLAAFKLGASGYILKNIRCESLIGSLELISLGEKVLPGELIDQLPTVSRPEIASEITVPSMGTDFQNILSAREIEILKYLVVGFPNKLIARRLDLSEATVKVHVKGILRKLNVSNRTQAAFFALNNGMGMTLQDAATNEAGAHALDDSDATKAGELSQMANIY